MLTYMKIPSQNKIPLQNLYKTNTKKLKAKSRIIYIFYFSDKRQYIVQFTFRKHKRGNDCHSYLQSHPWSTEIADDLIKEIDLQPGAYLVKTPNFLYLWYWWLLAKGKLSFGFSDTYSPFFPSKVLMSSTKLLLRNVCVSQSSSCVWSFPCFSALTINSHCSHQSNLYNYNKFSYIYQPAYQ